MCGVTGYRFHDPLYGCGSLAECDWGKCQRCWEECRQPEGGESDHQDQVITSESGNGDMHEGYDSASSLDEFTSEDLKALGVVPASR